MSCSLFLILSARSKHLAVLNETEIVALFEGVPNFRIALSELVAGINVIDLLGAKAAVFPSKGEAKKMIQGGGVAINKNKVGSPDDIYNSDHLIGNKFLVVQKGKKNYFLIVAE